MRQRLTIILTFVVIIGLLVIINTLTHVQEEQAHDLEIAPNRSTYHSGPTGIRALHDFLNESGYRVMRWREPVSQLLGQSGQMVTTLVVVGDTRIPIEHDDVGTLKAWVARGGRLVVIDRTPDSRWLINPEWNIDVEDRRLPNIYTDPGDVNQMTESVSELKPIQPTLLTNNIESILPSRFASRLVVRAVPQPSSGGVGVNGRPGPGRVVVPVPSPSLPDEGDDEYFPENTTEDDSAGDTQPPPVARGAVVVVEGEDYTVNLAPVAHIADAEGAVLVDYAYGGGRIVLLSDPYIITNGGVRLKDNLALAINILGGPRNTGLIAFDEYHQGRGITRNPFASYFAGTAVLPIAGQLVLLVLAVLWTNGRRFARPLPLPHVDRRSSLEFVASMAELQERSRAYDLAIENIYTRIRRVLARHAGVDYNSSRSEIAARIAERSAIDRSELETVMRQCEEAINGDSINARQSIQLVRRLREIERDLGLRMRSRDARQAAENI